MKFTKGRDFYETNLKPFLLENIKRIDFAAAKKDVERFLEDKTELGLFNLKAIQGTIETVW